MISIDYFAKCDIRIVKVLSAERVEGSDKLLKLIVNAGDDPSDNSGQEGRQILAGIGKSYTPEEMVGKEILAIVNLEPRMMMGLVSQGMILAVGDDIENISLLTPDKNVEPGLQIR